MRFLKCFGKYQDGTIAPDGLQENQVLQNWIFLINSQNERLHVSNTYAKADATDAIALPGCEDCAHFIFGRNVMIFVDLKVSMTEGEVNLPAYPQRACQMYRPGRAEAGCRPKFDVTPSLI